MFSLLRPEGKFIALELSKVLMKTERKIIYIKLEKIEGFSIGPKQEIITDNLLIQNQFLVKGKEFFIKNMSNSLDTLVMAKKSIEIHPRDQCTLLNGDSLLSFSVRKKFTLKSFFCFCKTLPN
jgi:hypothetical protein